MNAEREQQAQWNWEVWFAVEFNARMALQDCAALERSTASCGDVEAQRLAQSVKQAATALQAYAAPRLAEYKRAYAEAHHSALLATDREGGASEAGQGGERPPTDGQR